MGQLRVRTHVGLSVAQAQPLRVVPLVMYVHAASASFTNAFKDCLSIGVLDNPQANVVKANGRPITGGAGTQPVKVIRLGLHHFLALW